MVRLLYLPHASTPRMNRFHTLVSFRPPSPSRPRRDHVSREALRVEPTRVAPLHRDPSAPSITDPDPTTPNQKADLSDLIQTAPESLARTCALLAPEV